MQHHHQRQPVSEYPTTSRIEAFSDGVIAIIITIMVLELRVPQLAEAFSREEFLTAFRPLMPKLLTYAMSFLIIGILWVNHHGFYHSLKKSDGKLLWYNNFLLFWLSLIPFVTAFLGEHPLAREAAMLYGVVLMFATLAFMFMGRYVLLDADLLYETIPLKTRQSIVRRNYPGLALYVLSIVLAPVSVWISWTIFFLVPLYYFMPRRIVAEGA